MTARPPDDAPANQLYFFGSPELVNDRVTIVPVNPKSCATPHHAGDCRHGCGQFNFFDAEPAPPDGGPAEHVDQVQLRTGALKSKSADVSVIAPRSWMAASAAPSPFRSP